MQRLLPALLLALLLPLSAAAAQEFMDKPSTLSVKLQSDSPFVYIDGDGHAVVVGLVENVNETSPVTNVAIQASFYNDVDAAPLELVTGGSLMGVVPPGGVSPYMLRSINPNPNITQVSVSVLGFDSAPPKQAGPILELGEIASGLEVSLSGTLGNGPVPVSDARVHLAFYDDFDPPRILLVETVEIGDIGAGQQAGFGFAGVVDARASHVFAVAETDISYYEPVRAELPEPVLLTRLAEISSVTLEDSGGNRVSQLDVGSTVSIRGEAAPKSGDQGDGSYVYYAQVRESGAIPYIEHVAYSEGSFGAGPSRPSVEWTPQRPGLFFVETFAWDVDGIPIADPGPILLVHVR